MRITEHIYKRIQEEFPDLFVEALKAKAASTVFAEFLPSAALADPNGSPWGQYGNREIPPKRKTVVISFNNIKDISFLELQEIDKMARFLKRAGFSVFIPVGNELQNYDMQLFDHSHIDQVGNKTRAEMQRMALARNVPADEVFFIDDVKKEVDEKFLETLCNKFESIERDVPDLSADIYHSTEYRPKLIPQNVGRLTIQRYSSDEPLEDELEIIKKDLEKALSKYSSWNLTLDDDFILFERNRIMRERMRETWNAKEEDKLTAYELLLLMITDTGKNLDALSEIQHYKKRATFYSPYHIFRLVSAGIPIKAIANMDSKFISRIEFIPDFILQPGVSYAYFLSYTEDSLKEIGCKNAYELESIIALLDSLKKYELTKNEVGTKENASYPNLYYLSIESVLIQEQQRILIAHAQCLEELNVQKFEYFSEILHKNKSFQNLIYLTCNSISGEFDIEAPKLTYLKISTWQKKSAHIHLERLPHLSRLEIGLVPYFYSGPELERKDPIITSVGNKNLTELYIAGNIRSLNFIEELLANSPNLKLLQLYQTNVPEEDLKKLGHRFPNLQIKIVFSYLQHKIPIDFNLIYTGKPHQAVSTPSPSLQGGSEVDAGDPSSVYQSAQGYARQKKTVAHSGVSGGIRQETSHDDLRNCLSEVFAWGGVDRVRDASGKLKAFPTEQSTKEALGKSWRHEFVYEKYLKLLELQTALDSAVKKIASDQPSSGYQDIFNKLNEIKKFLEDKNEDYKPKFLNKEKTTTKKDLYERITNAIEKIRSQRPSVESVNALQQVTVDQKIPSPPKSPIAPQADKREEDVVYTNSATNELTSDFDTKHDPEKKFTMEEACKHVSKNKKNRFPYTRDGLYTLNLDEDTLFSVIESHVLFIYTLPAYQAVLPTDDSHDFYEFKEKINLKEGDGYKINSLSSHDILLQLTLNGRPLTDSDIEIQKDELGFYKLKAKVPLTGELRYILDVPSEQTGMWGRIPAELQTIITNIQSFPSREVDALHAPRDATAAQKLDAMYSQKKVLAVIALLVFYISCSN